MQQPTLIIELVFLQLFFFIFIFFSFDLFYTKQSIFAKWKTKMAMDPSSKHGNDGQLLFDGKLNHNNNSTMKFFGVW